MEAVAYQALKNLQDQHWWFEGRRRIVASLIAMHLRDTVDPKILEAGCGYGGNLRVLEQFGHLDCFEFDPTARAYASDVLGRPVALGHLPENPGFTGCRFDLIAMLDVLEHIEDDVASLASLRNLLDDRGKILVTVPAMPSLWSRHDELHHHKRRYTRRSLADVISHAGLKMIDHGYFNSFLFPLAAGQRLLQRLAKLETSVEDLPPALVNEVFLRIFSLEKFLIGKVRMPIGLSLFAVAETASK